MTLLVNTPCLSLKPPMFSASSQGLRVSSPFPLLDSTLFVASTWCRPLTKTPVTGGPAPPPPWNCAWVQIHQAVARSIGTQEQFTKNHHVWVSLTLAPVHHHQLRACARCPKGRLQTGHPKPQNHLASVVPRQISLLLVVASNLHPISKHSQ